MKQIGSDHLYAYRPKLELGWAKLLASSHMTYIELAFTSFW